VKLHPIGAGKYNTVRHFAKNAKDLAGANCYIDDKFLSFE